MMYAEQERKSFDVESTADLFGREFVLAVLDERLKKMIEIYHGVDVKGSDQLYRELVGLAAVLKAQAYAGLFLGIKVS